MSFYWLVHRGAHDAEYQQHALSARLEMSRLMSQFLLGARAGTNETGVVLGVNQVDMAVFGTC